MAYQLFGPDRLLGERPAMFIGGERVDSPQTRPVDNPATGEVFTEVPEATAEHVDQAMRAAETAQREWAGRSLPERAEVLAAVMREIDAHAEELAQIVVAEQGKTITEARGEIVGTRLFFDVAHGNKYAPIGEIFPPNQPGEHLMVREEPYGVVAAITPWNYPAAIFARKVAPAIMAGNAVVLKPSEVTPLAALALARLCQQAGVPDGVVNVVTGEGRVVGKQMCEHPVTQMVTLTGSSRAGQEILRQTAAKVIPVSLELGGKAPVIVFEDADLDAAVERAAEARFWNCGQVCTCNERTYVHASRYDEFASRFVEVAKQVKVADPTREDAQMGPKVSAEEWRKVKDFVDGAEAAGATVVYGGDRPAGAEFAKGYWFSPTVITGVGNEMDIVRQEVFGPVLPIVPFEKYDEVIAWANSTDYGLTAYVFTQNIDIAMRAVDDLQFGEVYVNKIGPEQPQGFHTGWKMSGLGGEDGKYGYQRYLRKKTVYLRYRG
ncbi:aldehyde dehydrogenase family protein [Thermoactinospora rubra]|uniref:aldehyde dehydrogenase family protein n=1 Tax=Thermoactinospora rubra TaxID=1088767 RepID=UPI000A109999|nr:aldehyde dehydrogenase family protein [Thermoactinospora rubra]